MARNARLGLCAAGAIAAILLIACVGGRTSGVRAEVADAGDAPAAPNDKPDIFEPEHDWKEVLDHQQIPGGLDVRFDLEKGKKYAKIMKHDTPPRWPSERRDASAAGAAAVVAVTPPEPQGGDAAGASADGVASSGGRRRPVHGHPDAVGHAEGQHHGIDTSDPSEDALGTARRVLLELPTPEPDLVDALRRKVPKAEFDALLARVWARRQKELKELMAKVEDDAKQMGRLIKILARSIGLAPPPANKEEEADDELASISFPLPDAAMAARLEDVEYLVSNLDNARDFVHMDGLVLLGALLNHGGLTATTADAASVPAAVDADTCRVVTNAAWALGTTVKYQPELQDQAVRAGLLPLVLRTLRTGVRMAEAANSRAGTDAAAGEVASKCGYDLAAKALYALGAMVRSHRDTQEQLVALTVNEPASDAAGGAGTAAATYTGVLESVFELARASAGTANGGGRSWGYLASKLTLLLGDLATDEWNLKEATPFAAADGEATTFAPAARVAVPGSAPDVAVGDDGLAAVELSDGAEGGVKVTSLFTASDRAEAEAAMRASHGDERQVAHGDATSSPLARLLRGRDAGVDAAAPGLCEGTASSLETAVRAGEGERDAQQRAIGALSALTGHCVEVYREPTTRRVLDDLLGLWAAERGDVRGAGHDASQDAGTDALADLERLLAMLPPPRSAFER